MHSSNDKTYLIVDGGNIDVTPGLSVFERQSDPEKCPRWGRVPEGVRRVFDEEAKGLFFFNSSSGALLMGFVQALTAMDYTVIPLSGPEDAKVVDVDLQCMMEVAGELEPGGVISANHDVDSVPQVKHLLDLGHNVAVIRSHEFLASGLYELEEKGFKTIDFEHDVHAFQVTLPRLRIIDVSDLNPLDFS